VGLNYAIIDIETTGDKPKNFKIIEIAIIKHDGKKEIDRYTSFVDPQEKINPFISRLTGIYDADVKGAPMFFEIAKEVVEFTKDCVFVAHNVSFDYGVIRREYRRLGYDYRLPHMCTVQTSRILIPGHKSYGLKNITKALNIPLNGHHRAIADTEATAKLFEMLYERDEKNELESFIKIEINPKVLHSNLDLDALDEIPDKVGIYKFFNEKEELIYIGKSIHIKKRIEQHLKNSKTAKAVELRSAICRIEHELTGSELIALLHESEEIKKHQPIYNRAQKNTNFTHGLFTMEDQGGYINLHVQKISATDKPLITFTSLQSGKRSLEYWLSEFKLCQRLCHLYKSTGACFNFTIKNCEGACIGEESPESYNKKVNDLLNNLNFNYESFLIVDKGRNSKEHAFVLVRDGVYSGFGYMPRYIFKRSASNYKKFITLKESNRDFQSIIKMQLYKNEKLDIHHLKQ
jgi:DNA polymerase-3 subunit epsilon